MKVSDLSASRKPHLPPTPAGSFPSSLLHHSRDLADLRHTLALGDAVYAAVHLDPTPAQWQQLRRALAASIKQEKAVPE